MMLTVRNRSLQLFFSLSLATALPTVLLAEAPRVRAGEELVIIDTRETSSGLSASAVLPRDLKFVKQQGQLQVASPRDLAVSESAGVQSLEAKCAEITKARPYLKCEPNVLFKAAATPNDSYWPYEWNLQAISAPQAWDISTGSAGPLVAVVDTGVDYSHPDLKSNIAINSGEIAGNHKDDDGDGFVDDVYGYDFSDRDSTPWDLNGHGTHVAGIIGAAGNDGFGVPGVNWSAKILPVRVLDADGSGTLAGVVAGINYAVKRGAKVINLSLGAPYGSKMLLESLKNAQDHGVLIVVAAGNEAAENSLTPSFPASYQLDNLISVAATDSEDHLADFSNYGVTSVHLAAPGVDILSTFPLESHAFMSGTSMASPHVAGAAALVMAVNPALSALEVKDMLLNTADVLPSLSGLVITSGRLNVGAAVAKALQGQTPSHEDLGLPAQLAIDLSSKLLRGGRRTVFNAKVYSLVDSTPVTDAALSLVCGGRIVASAVSDFSGAASFTRARGKKNVRCYVMFDNGSVSASSNPVVLKAAGK